MTIITGSALTATPVTGEDLRYPVLCFDNVVDTNHTTSTSETTGYPLTTRANPSTNLLWRAQVHTDTSPTSDQYVIVTTSAEFDYLALARHNFGTLGVLVSVECLQGRIAGTNLRSF